MTEKEKVINVALGEVGYREKETNSNLDDKTANTGDENYTKYARDLDNVSGFYNGKKNGYDWCDVFVDWCFVQAFGVDRALELLCQPKKSTGAGCGFSKNFYKNKGQLYDKPAIGDQIFFENSSGVYHTGIVYKVDNDKVYTVEGNTRKGNTGNYNEVCKKEYPLNADYIGGYGRPKYEDIVTEEKEELQSDKVIITVKVTASDGLNLRKEPNTSSGILKAFTKGTSLKIYEIKNNWGRTNDGWICLDYTDYSKSTTTSSTTSTKKYRTGRYVVNTEVLTVRKGAGTNYDWLKYSELTSNAQSQVYSKCGYKPNGLCAGVVCDVSEVKENWGKIPSGWICLDYCKKQ